MESEQFDLITRTRSNLTRPHQKQADIYGTLREISYEATRSTATYTGLLAAEPSRQSYETWKKFALRNEVLRRWQRACLSLFRASVAGDAPKTFASAVLDHLSPEVGWSHHKLLPLEKVGTPCFFRTDQANDGKILEVQCPGSLWGVHEILRELYLSVSEGLVCGTTALSAAWAAALTDRLQQKPVIQHLLDNSSHPAGERFFIQRARKYADYFGFDEVRPQDCNFVRSHDFPSLLVENFAAKRLATLTEGRSVYDLPPVALFDQKLLLALPFWDETRDHFDDQIREMFPWTMVLSPDGLRLPDGAWTTLDQFSALPRNRRHYYLKYAGSDVARNWGSRAVFHVGKLSPRACLQLLQQVTAGFAAGERWILQEERNSRAAIRFLSREGELIFSEGHAKNSVFYGPTGPLGALSMHENFYKVHGSTHTVASILIPSGVNPGTRF